MSKKLILIAALVLTFGGGAAVFFLMPELLPGFIRPVTSEEAEAHEAGSTEKQKHEVDADLDVFVVNLVGDGPSRYLRTTLSLGVASEEEKEEVTKGSAPIRHAVIMYLTERKVEELLSPEGKDRVRTELQKAINAALGRKLVHSVYFKEFLIQ
jgi:flagellar FliL protein